MKKINSILAFRVLPLLLIILTFGCEEVIEIDLNSADPHIVTQGNIMPDSVAQLQLFYTSDYFDPKAPEFIADAEVILNDDKGGIDTLKHIGEGFYNGKSIIGQENTEYHLKIIKDSELYECTTFLGEKPEVHSIKIDTFDIGFDMGDEIFRELEINIVKGKHVRSPFLVDFESETVEFGNGYYVISDRSAEEDTLRMSIVENDFIEDDDLGITIYTIDEQIYDFFRMMNDALNTNSMSSTTPYNPVSNISNGMLGYFAATVPSTYHLKIKTGEYYIKK